MDNGINMKLIGKIVGFIWMGIFLTFFIVSISGRNTFPPVFIEFSIWFRSIFLVVFFVGWFGVNYKQAKDSGWKDLASIYAYNFKEPDSIKFYSGSGYIGKIINNRILRVSVTKEGIFIKKMFIFSIGHKPIFIPWGEVSGVLTKKSLLPGKTPKIIRKIAEFFLKKVYKEIKLKKFPHQYLIINWVLEFDKDIPVNLINKLDK